MYLANWHQIIYRANLDGVPQVETLVRNAGASEVIDLDLSRGKMYWAGWRGSTLKRANLDGTQVETIVSPVGRIYDIDIDEVGGKIYWAGRSRGVLRANLDGTQVETFVTGRSNGVAIDVGGGKIYWTDYSDNAILWANLDGSPIIIEDADGLSYSYQSRTLVSGVGAEPEDIALGP